MNVQTEAWNRCRTGLLVVLLCLIVPPALADPVFCPDTGSYYEFVSGLMDWEDAVLVAEAREHEGLQGHLAVVTSLAENEFISVNFASGQSDLFAWIAGYEPDDDGVWIWGAGPESGVQFSDDDLPTPPFFFANWGGHEPNDHVTGEDYVAINLGGEFANIYPGEWIDSPNPNPSDPIQGLIVEYEDSASAVRPGESPGAARQMGRLEIAPNPFNPATTISFDMPTTGPVRLAVYDVRGQLLRLLVDQNLEAGKHWVRWDGRDGAGLRAASGTYFCRLFAGDAIRIGKLILVQ